MSCAASGRGSRDGATGSGACWCIASAGRWRRWPPAWLRRASRCFARRVSRRPWKRRGPRPRTSSSSRPPSPSGCSDSVDCQDSPPCWPWAKFHRGCQRRLGAPLYPPASPSRMPYCTPSKAWRSFRGEGGQGVTAGKVLIVEDNPVNLRLAQFLLEKKGFSVRKAGSGAAEDCVMSEQAPKPSRAGESVSKSNRPYTDILQLNQELVQSLQGLVDEHEARKKEVDELRFTHDQAQGEIARLQEELRHANQRDSERHEQLRQLEQERVDQLGAMSAHLDALRSAVDRYLQQGRKAA